MKKYIICDLDGTLIDTLKGITKAVNVTLKELNINKEYPEEVVKTFIGNGGRMLFKRALERDYTEEEFTLFLKNYEKYQYISPLYEGVLETLNFFKSRGDELICYSNKPESILKKLIENKFPKDYFLLIKGENKLYKNKPDVKYLLEFFENKGISLDNVHYIGDSLVDVKTARNLDIIPIIVRYGYGNYEEIKKETCFFLDNFITLEDIIV